jgi:hypothetical protein
VPLIKWIVFILYLLLIYYLVLVVANTESVSGFDLRAGFARASGFHGCFPHLPCSQAPKTGASGSNKTNRRILNSMKILSMGVFTELDLNDFGHGQDGCHHGIEMKAWRRPL